MSQDIDAPYPCGLRGVESDVLARSQLGSYIEVRGLNDRFRGHILYVFLKGRT